jgi:ABC-2 type transport system ATP-binding protein
VLDALQLADRVLDRPVRTYSKGMRQKVAIAQAVQHDPDLLLLDEPSEGLDPLVQHDFTNLLRERRDAGRTIFFSSHTLSEVQALCDHVAIVRAGLLVANATYDELTTQHPRVVTLTNLVDPEGSIARLGAGWTIAGHDGDDVVLHVTVDPHTAVEQLATLRFDDVSIATASLEDVFLSYYAADDGERTAATTTSEGGS